MSAGNKIIEGLKAAVRGDLSRVSFFEGDERQVWTRHDVDSPEGHLSFARDAIADMQTEMDMLKGRLEEAIRERDEAREQIAGLLDPVIVHVNMLRGTIAMPSLTSFLHAMGNHALVAVRETVEIAGRNEQSIYIERARHLLSIVKGADLSADAERHVALEKESDWPQATISNPDIVRSSVAEARSKAIEDCAKVAESKINKLFSSHWNRGAVAIAESIRALKGGGE